MAAPFDAALTDVFAVQADIAVKVADALGVVLGDSARRRLAVAPTDNLAAHDEFLKGEAAAQGMKADKAGLRRAIDYYERAVELDSSFAEAWSQLSRARTSLYSNGVPDPALGEAARTAAERARALAPNDPLTYLAAGDFYSSVNPIDNRPRPAEYEHGVRLAPEDVDLLSAAASASSVGGEWDSVAAQLQHALRLDPRSFTVARRLATVRLFLRQYPAADSAIERAIEFAPTNAQMVLLQVMIAVARGDLAGARAVVAAPPADRPDDDSIRFLAMYQDLYWVLDDAQQRAGAGLPPAAFDDDRGVVGDRPDRAVPAPGGQRLRRGLCRFRAARSEAQSRAAPEDAQRHVLLGVALALSGTKGGGDPGGPARRRAAAVSRDAIRGLTFSCNSPGSTCSPGNRTRRSTSWSRSSGSPSISHRDGSGSIRPSIRCERTRAFSAFCHPEPSVVTPNPSAALRAGYVREPNLSDVLFTRREVIAALASTAALPLIAACTRERARENQQRTRTRLARCSSKSPKTSSGCFPKAPPLWVSTQARERRFDLSSPIVPPPGSSARLIRSVPISSGSRPSPWLVSPSPSAPVWMWFGVATPERSRDSLFRMETLGGQLAQHAVRRDSERRCLSRRPPLPRQRPSDRECRRRRGLPYPDAVLRQAARRRARRMQVARGHGAGSPAFLIDKALAQMGMSAKNAREGGSLVESIDRRTKEHSRQLGRRARTIAAQEVAPALERQMQELQTQRATATNDAGMWARPHGEEFYRWALEASTTTRMSPDEVHEMGRSELERSPR